jgi:hypothetical protein
MNKQSGKTLIGRSARQKNAARITPLEKSIC